MPLPVKDSIQGVKNLLRPRNPLDNPLYRLLVGSNEKEEPGLVETPCLDKVASELAATGAAAEMYNEFWELVWISDELKLLLGESDEEELGYGKHIVECYSRDVFRRNVTPLSQIESFQKGISFIARDTVGGAKEVNRLVRERYEAGLAKALGSIEAIDPPPMWVSELEFLQGELPPVKISCVNTRIYSSDGVFQGTIRVYNPGLKASILALVSRGNEEMFERMVELFDPGPRKAAILFADLQSSTLLSRKLPSSIYFSILSALTRAIDDTVIGEGGIVGKHVGDGATAFFLADDMDGIQSGCRAAIAAARGIQAAATELAEHASSELGQPVELVMNIGLHWGGTLYMGQIVTGGRLEVTALGDEVNECSRIEDAAYDGEILASKALLERLSEEQAAALAIDPHHLTYRTIAEIYKAPSKAKQDAGSIPVVVIP